MLDTHRGLANPAATVFGMARLPDRSARRRIAGDAQRLVAAAFAAIGMGTALSQSGAVGLRAAVRAVELIGVVERGISGLGCLARVGASECSQE